MCGLPGAGKSALADGLGQRHGWPVLSVDPVEAALFQSGIEASQPTGLAAYIVVETLAERLLSLGQTVIVDAVNDASEARQQWLALAIRASVSLEFVEVICSDRELHRSRLESRQRGLRAFPEPSWASLEPRRTALGAWNGERITVDSVNDHLANLQLVSTQLQAPPGPTGLTVVVPESFREGTGR